ncbi:MAG TPA: 4-hydroxy-3-methylbut-2-enyl diphosphate reductase, partial [Candidatus Latescibacteria bacterium]|nr:4-hydroxy-3-methylbut-2-enyl diphosphate reductase [Candidatus Latescibacterota bacterium]
MIVEKVKGAGFCFGVKRALRIALDVARTETLPVYTIGPIIHNPQMVERLRNEGVVPIEDIHDVPPGTVVVRSHGIKPCLLEEAEDRGHRVVDATCPFVRKAQNYAAELCRAGYKVVIVGKKDHPEVEGLLGHAGGDAVVVYEESDLKDLGRYRRIGVIAQTTIPLGWFSQIMARLMEHTRELKAYNTICSSTHRRQSQTVELARKADLMIIVGGRNSANTSRLVELCRKIGTKTCHIEVAEEILPDWVKGKELVGISA